METMKKSNIEICYEVLISHQKPSLLAISYRNQPMTLWDLGTKEFLGQFQKDGSEDIYPAPQCSCIAFNPNPEPSLLAAAFDDGDLYLTLGVSHK